MKLLKWIYRIFLMPYLERDKYFDEVCGEAAIECEAMATQIISSENKYTKQDLKDAFSFGFSEGLIYGMNTDFKCKPFEEWLKERQEKK
jgi:hypothetical protein